MTFVDEHVIGRFLQIAPRRVLEMARRGEIPAHPIGHKRKTWRFRLSEIEAYFSAPEARNVGATISAAVPGTQNRWVLPRWGDKKAADIKPLEIEAWFEALTSLPNSKKKTPLAWPSVTKLKSLMSQVFKHAQRHELIPATIGTDGRPSNPVVLARSESHSSYEAVVITPGYVL